MTYQPPCDVDASAAPIKGPIPFERATTEPFFTLAGPLREYQDKGRCVGLARIPWYLPRSLKLTTSDTMICATVINPPPPIPEIARNTIS
jgi:hypothetical protein